MALTHAVIKHGRNAHTCMHSSTKVSVNGVVVWSARERVNRHFCTVFVIRQLMIQLNYVHSELTFICAKFVR